MLGRGLIGTLAPAALLMAAAGCSLGTFDQEPCVTNTDCRDVFGVNAVCGAEGFCSVAEVSPRCTKTFPDDLLQRPERYPGALVFGNLMDRSEPRKLARENAARLAVLQANEEGGLDGRQLAMVFCDIREDSSIDTFTLQEAAVSSAEHLVQTFGVPAIVGPSGSAETLAVFEAVSGDGTLVISPAASSPELTEAEPQSVDDDNPGLLWRTAPPDTVQGAAISVDMQSRGITSVAIIHQTGAYGEGLRDAFTAAAPSNINIVETQAFSTSSQRTEAIATIGVLMVEEVLFISSNSDDVTAFYTAVVSNVNYDTKSLFLTDSAASSDLVDSSHAPLFMRIRGTRPRPLSASDPVYNIFVGGYSGEYNGEDPTNFSFTAHAYDAAWLTLYGAARSLQVDGAVNGRGIARGLRRISSGNEVEIKPSSWVPVTEAFSMADGSIDISGASGDLDYNPTTEETTGPIEVWRIVEVQNGVYEIQPDP